MSEAINISINPPSSSNSHVEKLRICIRKLPSAFTYTDFLYFLKRALGSEMDSLMKLMNIIYNQGYISKHSSNDSVPSVAFITFLNSKSLNHFCSLVKDKPINDEGYIPSLEYSPIQLCTTKTKKDPLEGSIKEGILLTNLI